MLRPQTTLCALSAALLLSGCGNNDGSSELSSDFEKSAVSEVGETFNNEIDKLKDADFANISFADLKVYPFLEIDGLMPGKYTDGQKLNEIYFADSGHLNDEGVEQPTVQFIPFGEKAEQTTKQFPNYRQYKENDLETETPRLLFDVVNYGLRVCSSGAAVKRGDNDRKALDYYYLTGKYNVVLYTEETEQERSFELQSGELSIGNL